VIGPGYNKEYMSVLAICFNVIWFITKLLEAEILTLLSWAICFSFSFSFEFKVKVKSLFPLWCMNGQKTRFSVQSRETHYANFLHVLFSGFSLCTLMRLIESYSTLAFISLLHSLVVICFVHPHNFFAKSRQSTEYYEINRMAT
jgi:hypothetical protein